MRPEERHPGPDRSPAVALGDGGEGGLGFPGHAGVGAARVLAASVATAVRIALEQWVRPAGAPSAAGGLVVPSGSLPELLRTALAPLTPALDAAEGRPPQ